LIDYKDMIPGGEMIERFIRCMESIPQDSSTRGISLGDSSVRGGNPKEIYPFPFMSKGERYSR
jgi:hypothetical protein